MRDVLAAFGAFVLICIAVAFFFGPDKADRDEPKAEAPACAAERCRCRPLAPRPTGQVGAIR